MHLITSGPQLFSFHFVLRSTQDTGEGDLPVSPH